jgi:hypothetical protein
MLCNKLSQNCRFKKEHNHEIIKQLQVTAAKGNFKLLITCVS